MCLFVCSVERPNGPKACGRCCFQGHSRRGRGPLPSRCVPGHPTHSRQMGQRFVKPNEASLHVVLSWPAGETQTPCLVSPCPPRESEVASSRAKAKGSQLGSAWQPSRCWPGGFRLRIEVSVLVPRAGGVSAQLPPDHHQQQPVIKIIIIVADTFCIFPVR